MARLLKHSSFDGPPGQSDDFYDVEVDRPEEFIANLRHFYLTCIGDRGKTN